MLRINKLENAVVITQNAEHETINRMKEIQSLPDSNRIVLLAELLAEQKKHIPIGENISVECVNARHILLPFNECTEPNCTLSRCNNPAARVLIERKFISHLPSQESIDIAIYGGGGFFTELYVLAGLNGKVKTLNLHMTGDKFEEIVEHFTDESTIKIDDIDFDREDKTNYFKMKLIMFSRIIQWMRAIDIETNIYIHSSNQLDIGNIMDVVMGIDIVDQFPAQQQLNFRDLMVSSIKDDGLVLLCYAGMYHTRVTFYISKYDEYVEDSDIERIESEIEALNIEVYESRRVFIDISEKEQFFPNRLHEIKGEFNQDMTLDELKEFITEEVDVSDIHVHMSGYIYFTEDDKMTQVILEKRNQVYKLKLEDFQFMLYPVENISPFMFYVKSIIIMFEPLPVIQMVLIFITAIFNDVFTLTRGIFDILFRLIGYMPIRSLDSCMFGTPKLPMKGTLAHLFGIKGPTNVGLEFEKNTRGMI